MYCAKCGTQSVEGDVFCRKCGSPLSQTTPPVQTPPASAHAQGVRRTSGLAVASLVLGIIGFSILAIIFGGVAINQTGKDPNLSGRGMAVAGLVLGIIGLVAGIIIFAAIIGGAMFL